jgi:hypothetical protein
MKPDFTELLAKADFSGYATKAGLKCTDGRVIMQDAFKHQDGTQVPLVWQHGHTDPENVLGHAILQNREDGVYAYGFFNRTAKATHLKEAVDHKDIKHMSIWANDLIQRASNVLHGAIREVSLVLSGANPGALIENVSIRHSDGDEIALEDEAIIYTGLELSHAAVTVDSTTNNKENDADNEDRVETVQDIYESMTDKQKDVLHYMLGELIEANNLDSTSSDNTDSTDNSSEMKQDNLTDNTNPEGKEEMTRNVFEGNNKTDSKVLSHAQLQEIVASAVKTGSLRDAVDQYALQHGITDIDTLFPDATAVDAAPEWLKRRTDWVDRLLMATRKSPFSRIKTLYADITMDDARAKGYIKGDFKKEEFFSVAKRVTTPTTIYKKQKLDRDDMVDITDFDVVSWLKSEMRLMLDEELARAILIGDGRDIASDEKINEGNIRPIAKDHELYTITLTANVDDANSSAMEVIDLIISNRWRYKGTGQPTLFTTETQIARFMLLKDTTGRRIYKSLAEIAADLRVAEIIPVEVMEDEPNIIGILVNPVDYVVGADKGGQVSMFDDFDIDYNQQKYLIETRVCGALVKLKSAMVIRKTASTNVLVTPNMPTFNHVTGVLSITNQTGVVYTRTNLNGSNPTVVNAAGSPYAAIAAGASIVVTATPAAGYYFSSSDDDSWTFTRDQA